MSDINQITGRQLAAARALVGIGQVELAASARVSAPTLRRMESSDGMITGMANNVAAIITELERLGVEFLDGDYAGSGGPGVRLRDKP
ncbi:transcriptional regulator [Mesorhizobium sp. M1322]|uniref:transcriptional regulator n=1 Tax=Mesorhizobium sp. M1322 TaxID=2957081 RepID=UPI003334BFCD